MGTCKQTSDRKDKVALTLVGHCETRTPSEVPTDLPVTFVFLLLILYCLLYSVFVCLSPLSPSLCLTFFCIFTCGFILFGTCSQDVGPLGLSQKAGLPVRIQNMVKSEFQINYE